MASTIKQQQDGNSALTGGTTRKPDSAPPAPSGDGIRGEGNYEAARRFNAAERRFVESGKVDAAARAAAPRSAAERQAMLEAEAEAVGKRRAKDEDPALTRPPRGTEKL